MLRQREYVPETEVALEAVSDADKMIKGHESSGTPSAHAASAGQHGPGHSANHPEPVEEHFGVCASHTLPQTYFTNPVFPSAVSTSQLQPWPSHSPTTSSPARPPIPTTSPSLHD
jgi:hypothetical protein